MNSLLLDWLNGGLAGRWDVLDDEFAWWAKNGVFLLMAFAGAQGILELRCQPRRAVWVLAAVILGAAVAGLVLLGAGQLVSESRPFVSDRDTVQLLRHAADNSFPSDHATLAALVATAASLAWPRRAAIFLGLALVVGLFRVFSGVHYPGDIAAGWAIGGLSAVAGWLLIQPDNPRWQRWSFRTG